MTDTQEIIEASEVQNEETLEVSQGFTFEDAIALLRSTDPFPVSTIQVAGWLGFAEKRRLQDRLKALFCVGTDYVESHGRKSTDGVKENADFSNFDRSESAPNGDYMLICWMTRQCFTRLLFTYAQSDSPNPGVQAAKKRATKMLRVLKSAKDFLVAEKQRVTVNNSPIEVEKVQERELSKVSQELKQAGAQLIAKHPDSIVFVRLMIDRAAEMETATATAKTIASQAVGKAQGLSAEVEQLQGQLSAIGSLGLDFSAFDQVKAEREALAQEREDQLAEYQMQCEQLSAEYQAKCAEAEALTMKLRQTIVSVNEANQSAWVQVQRSMSEFEKALIERGDRAGLNAADLSLLRQSLPDIAELRLELPQAETEARQTIVSESSRGRAPLSVVSPF